LGRAAAEACFAGLQGVFLGAFFYARVRFVSKVGFYFDQDTR